MKHLFIFLSLLMAQHLMGQYVITGRVVDAETSKPISNVQISVVGTSNGAITGGSGEFVVKSQKSKGAIDLFFVGYNRERRNFIADGDTANLGIVMLTNNPVLLEEIIVKTGVADKASDPVTVTEISAKSIKQQLNDKPLPMLFNTSPGVFSVTNGGGSGDALMSIRGFKQDNIGIMLNGVPVNGIENGLVYWSNWQGLSDASASIQIQKGPGVANVAANAVGGSVNIITYNPIKSKGGMLSWQVMSYGNQKVTLALNSGKMDNGWNISFLGSYEKGPGYIDATYVKSWSYYLSATKSFSKKSKLNITFLGSPQHHGQRTLLLSKEEIDRYGYLFNRDWGGYNGKIKNASENFYHKPFLSLNHYLTINSKQRLANSLYISLGNGGGLWSESFNYAPSIFTYRNASGQLDWTTIHNINSNNDETYALANGDEVSGYSLNVQTKFLASHVVAGWMSTYEQTLNNNLKLKLGFHYRYFNSFLREEVFDLLGGDFFIEDYGWSVAGVAGRNQIMMPGDIIRVNNNSIVNFVGGYAQLIYRSAKFNAYLSANGNGSFYQRVDRFNYVNNIRSEIVTKPGFDFRGGVAYKLNTNSKVYVNGAYLNKAPYFKYVFGNFTNVPVQNLKNEKVTTAELGYVFNNNGWHVAVDGYYTLRKNVSMLSNEYVQLEDNKQSRAMVNGLDAVHKGVEASITYRWQNSWKVDVFGSLGNYRWQNDVVATLFNDNNVAVDTVYVFASGLYVGGTAQQQLGAALNFRLLSLFNIRSEWIWFGKLYADFDPVTRTDSEDRVQPYQFPDYSTLNLYVNIPFFVGDKHGNVDLSFNNILNSHYITVGQDGVSHSLQTFRGFWSEGFIFSLRLSVNI